MTFHVKDMLGESKTLNVMGATVVYNPQALTTADFEALYSEDPGVGRVATVVEILSHTLLSWDLADDEGEIPITAEGIRRLPMGVLNAIFDAIDESSGPGSEEGNVSPEHSSTPPSGSTQPPPTSLNGGDLSSAPATLASRPGSSPTSIPAG